MKQLDWRTFLVGLAFLSGTVFAADMFSGDLGNEDLLFSTEVLIGGVELPSNMDATTGTSTVSVEGTGTLTVGDRSRGLEELNVTVLGGTTIKSERKWSSEDAKTWFEGVFPAPRSSGSPLGDNVVFSDTGKHSNSFVSMSSAFGMGLVNETFKFSTPAVFTFPAELPDGKKLWLALKASVTPTQNANSPQWTISEGDYCIITGGSCYAEIDSINEVVLVEEYFYSCVPSIVANGDVGSTPDCLVTCDSGYELDYETTRCVAGEETVISPAAEEPIVSVPEEVAAAEEPYRSPKFHRYVGELRGRYLNEIEEEPAENKDAGLMEYLLQIRNYFGAGTSANVVRSEEVGIDSETEEVYSSAPLLPQTGPGIFLGLAAIGLGCMVVGARGRRR